MFRAKIPQQKLEGKERAEREEKKGKELENGRGYMRVGESRAKKTKIPLFVVI